MTNAEKFKAIFGLYATEVWSKSEKEFLEWLNAPTETYHKVGKWVKAHGGYCTPGGDPVWECPACGKGRHVYGIEHGSYGADVADHQWVACPNCGTPMEGEAW